MQTDNYMQTASPTVALNTLNYGDSFYIQGGTDTTAAYLLGVLSNAPAPPAGQLYAVRLLTGEIILVGATIQVYPRVYKAVLTS